jgi:hypothetical protein
VDALLRGEFTRREALAEGRLDIGVRTLAGAVFLLGGSYGACMGFYAFLRHETGGLLQLLSSTLKVPALFLLTLLVTAPSLYVFSALCRSKLGPRHTVGLLLLCTAAMATVLASLGPVTVFFTLSTRSHAFIQVLNVAVFAVAGAVGLTFLRNATGAMFAGDADQESAPACASLWRRTLPTRSTAVFLIWIVTYALVGAQMGWILRPFVGAPNLPWEFLRETESNIFDGLVEALRYL